MKKYEAAIIGGGLSGLTAAVYLAKAGIQTVIIEKGKEVGGRAQTVKKKGAYLNLGAHALYKGGEAEAILHELGIEPQGGTPGTKGSAIWNQSIRPLPHHLSSLFSTKLFSWSGKMEFGKVMMKLTKLNPEAVGSVNLREWAENEITDPMVRHTFYALCRTSTYCIEPEKLSARNVLAQVQKGLRGVLYIDGGWQTMVGALKTIAVDAGATVIEHQSVDSVKKDNQFMLSLKNGEKLEASYVISTAGPEQTYTLMKGAEDTSLDTWRKRVKPVYAACLDVSLRHLPQPNEQFAIGIDQHILFTNQSRAATVSEDGSSVISVLKYLGTETTHDPEEDKLELERTMDLMQPGWRNELGAYQFLPRIAVVQGSCAMMDYVPYGPSVPELPGFYVAGDGAGHTEMLVDAAFASAKRAASAIIQKYGNLRIRKEA
ncbi:Flavin containing amine oxidoreductase [Fictibacillus solisalsi]|uniref:Flavin containing amine oxidoreductase n=1 Tax=Fictibacillus solisalsi TaxID=459525 RepID=A0A1G9TS40_9BACL|nr:FAD-dependent oxidoreductase [Fictibacillus solisalsi]SDM50559.1 Flavin containing amine oxidoreductase [Fictibacillus solisalsi]